MYNLAALRNAIANGLAADKLLVADKVSVQVHGGDFDEKELKKFSAMAPSVVVSLLDANVSQMSGTSFALCTFGLACITKDRAGLLKAEGAIKLVNQVLLALNRNPFWKPLDDGLKRPQTIVAKNEYSAKLNDLGCAIWSIGFQQQVELDDTDNLVLDDLSTVGIRWDLSPTDNVLEATDVVEDLDAEPIP